MVQKKLIGTSSFHFYVLAAAVFSIIFIELRPFPLYVVFDLSLVTLLILWISAAIKNKSWIIKENPLTKPLLLFAAAGIISGIFAYDKISCVSGVVGILIGILMVHILTIHIRKKEQVLLLYDLLLIGGIIMAVVGFYQWLIFHQWIPAYFPFAKELGSAGSGFYITTLIKDVSRTGGYWYFIAPLAFVRVLYGDKKEDWKSRTFWLVGLFFILFDIVAGNLKMPLVVLCLTLIYLIFKSKNWKLGLTLVSLILLVGMLVPNITLNRFKVFLNPSYYSQVDDRPALQIKALKAWPKHGFLFGTGVNNHGRDIHGNNPQGPHNMFLVILGETGLFGGLAFVLILIKYFQSIPKITLKSAVELKRIHYSASTVMIGGLIGSFSYHILTGPPTLNLFWVLIAIAMSFTVVFNTKSK